MVKYTNYSYSDHHSTDSTAPSWHSQSQHAWPIRTRLSSQCFKEKYISRNSQSSMFDSFHTYKGAITLCYHKQWFTLGPFVPKTKQGIIAWLHVSNFYTLQSAIGLFQLYFINSDRLLWNTLFKLNSHEWNIVLQTELNLLNNAS